jgi:hypothetical protein
MRYVAGADFFRHRRGFGRGYVGRSSWGDR